MLNRQDVTPGAFIGLKGSVVSIVKSVAWMLMGTSNAHMIMIFGIVVPEVLTGINIV
jgi:hypothetical protein